MTKILVDKTVIEQALDALEGKISDTHPFAHELEKVVSVKNLRKALENHKPEEIHHVWGCRANAFGECDMGCSTHVRTKDLTDDEIYTLYSEPCSDREMIEFARAVIAADREKNK